MHFLSSTRDGLSRIPQFLAAIAFVACCAWLANGTASAGCGDYIFVRNHEGKLVRASTLAHSSHQNCPGGNCDSARFMLSLREQVHLAEQSQAPLHAPKRGCQGPFCDGEAPVPTAPFSPTPTPSNHSRSLIALMANSAGNDRGTAGMEVVRQGRQLLATIHAPQDIFEPPRQS